MASPLWAANTIDPKNTGAADVVWGLLSQNKLENPLPDHLVLAEALIVGNTSEGVLAIDGGSSVTSRAGFGGISGEIGFGSSSWGKVSVRGAGSFWMNSGLLSVGNSGNAALNIEDGGAVSSDYGYINTSSSEATVLISGDGSIWTNANSLTVGNADTGRLTIENGGSATNTIGTIGEMSGSQGYAIVRGLGSSWTNSSSLYVGYRGSGELTVEDGGIVTARTLYASPNSLHGNGTIDVNGAVLDDIHLTFEEGQSLQRTIPFGTGGQLNLNLEETSSLGAGFKASGELTIANGMTIETGGGAFGILPGSSGKATVTGNGSTWTSQLMQVGVRGSGELVVDNGGRIFSTSGAVGSFPNFTSSQGKVIVSGAGSLWATTSNLRVGNRGRGEISVLDGGVISIGGNLILSSPSSSRLSITLDDLTDPHFEVAGTAQLSGVINVILQEGFRPARGAEFHLVRASSIAGLPVFAFDDAPLADGLYWDTSSFLADGTIRVANVVPEPSLSALMIVSFLVAFRRRLGNDRGFFLPFLR